MAGHIRENEVDITENISAQLRILQSDSRRTWKDTDSPMIARMSESQAEAPEYANIEPDVLGLGAFNSSIRQINYPRQSRPSNHAGKSQMLKALARTEITLVSTYTATVWFWISIILLLIDFILFVVAFSTVGWGVVSLKRSGEIFGHLFVGLWQQCDEGEFGCHFYSTSDVSGGFAACQAFATLTLIGILGSIATCIPYVYQIRVKPAPVSGKVLFGFRLATAFTLLILVSIFGATWGMDYTSEEGYETSTSYSFVLSIITLVFEIVSSAFVGLEVFTVRKPEAIYVNEDGSFD